MCPDMLFQKFEHPPPDCFSSSRTWDSDKAFGSRTYKESLSILEKLGPGSLSPARTFFAGRGRRGSAMPCGQQPGMRFGWGFAPRRQHQRSWSFTLPKIQFSNLLAHVVVSPAAAVLHGRLVFTARAV